MATLTNTSALAQTPNTILSTLLLPAPLHWGYLTYTHYDQLNISKTISVIHLQITRFS